MLIRNLGARYMPVPSALARPGRARAQTSARTAKQRFIRFSPFFGKLAAAVRGSRQHSGCSSLARRSDIFKNNYSMPYFITYEIYLFFIACFFQDTLPPQEQNPSPQWLILHDMSSFPGKGLLCFFYHKDSDHGINGARISSRRYPCSLSSRMPNNTFLLLLRAKRNKKGRSRGSGLFCFAGDAP